MLHCYFCKTTIADVETAIEADWISHFYDGKREISHPVCPDCTSARLQLSGDYAFELAEHTRYADEAESAQRAGAWPQAAALWQQAAGLCCDSKRRADYEKQAGWCRDMKSINQEQEN